MVTTNCSTLHTVYNRQQSATQGSNDTTHTHLHIQDSSNSPESIGCQKDGAKLFAYDPIRWAVTSQAFTRWHQQSEVELIW